ncbi:MAG: LuxR C-terminal-related transcriptional regulator [Muribaculum sp.]|nr:LuxR C-terminal-related transcriptional regulator [Muribaculum sp.]
MTQHYAPTDKMRSLIARDASILMVLSRFAISLGFGESTVTEVCERNNIDTDTFLAVANFITFDTIPSDNCKIDLKSLLIYLRGAHDYILDFFLPSIRRKLTEAITVTDNNKLSFLILKYFDEYSTEVTTHMRQEDATVFVHVERLLSGIAEHNDEVTLLSAHHESLSTSLKDIKELIIRYYPLKNSAYLNSALYDLIVCERDIMSHCRIEDLLLTPAIIHLEQSLHSPSSGSIEDSTHTDKRLQSLTEREREIIHCVARGMSNKEIADQLCVSVNTVTTHRRNLAAKLDIHSPAALTIFAILNNLINIDEIRQA